MKIWPYDPERINENKAGNEPITIKQLEYISKLDHPLNRAHAIWNDVLDSIPEWRGEYDYDLQKLTKGQAMYVIKCLLGDIKPVEITDDIRRRIMEAS